MVANSWFVRVYECNNNSQQLKITTTINKKITYYRTLMPNQEEKGISMYSWFFFFFFCNKDKNKLERFQYGDNV